MHSLSRLIYAWTSLLLTFTAPLTPAHAEELPVMAKTESVVYKVTPQGPLRLYFFYPEGHSADAGSPAVLFFFGGGWNQGGPEHFHGQAQHLADRGIVGITADYRTRKKHGTTPFECVADAITAMRYLRAHADELGLDPQRIGAGGGSAGGHLAMALSTVTADGLIPDDDGLAGQAFHPDALVLFNPVFNNGPGQYGHDRIGERYVDFSPAHNLHPEMPPTLVMLGDRDQLIPVAVAEDVRDGMAARGVRSELIIYPGQAHGFFNRRPESDEMYRATVRAMDDFFVSLGWLTPRP